ncbi:MAG: PilZ domain-containing protein [Deltaproteobacteria bacterium]|jgi:hypothetical protein|nr:PilZ domain-containing protein [Deltaproteobacteria bacterium]
MPDDSRHDALDFTIARRSPCRRGRYRVAARGLSMYLNDVAQAFEIGDLSSSGCNLRAPAELLAVGRIFDSGLYIGNTSYLTNIRLKVIRRLAGGGIACVFQSLSRRQEIMLDKLLLEIQKRSIATHAARGKREKHPCRNTLR